MTAAREFGKGPTANRSASLTYVLRDLGDLGGGSAQAWAVNNLGQVVGDGLTAGGLEASFIWTEHSGLQALLDREMFVARDINEKGQIVGFFVDQVTPFMTRAALLEPDGTVLELGTLEGGSSPMPSAINNRAEVVGTVALGDGVTTRAFYWSQESGMVSLGSLADGAVSAATDINDYGEVVGYAGTGEGRPQRAFRWTRVEGIQELPVIDESIDPNVTSVANGINNRGDVVGGRGLPFVGSFRAFLLTRQGTILEPELNASLPPSGSVQSLGFALNDAGDVVGSVTEPGLTNGFLWNADGTTSLLPDLGGGSTSPVGINARGTIIGTSITSIGKARAVVWTLQ